MTGVQVNGRAVSDRLRFERDIVALRPKLLGFAWSLARRADQAEDLVQDTYIKALSNWESFEPGTNLSAWLCTIMRNNFLSQKRRAWRSTPLDQEIAERTIVDPTVNQEEQLGFNQEFAQFAPLLGFIPLDMRDSVVAVHYLGIKYEDLAEILGCAVGTVKSRVSRGLEAMKTIMASERKYTFDLSPWAYAAQDVPRDHPYFPIAKAYEEIHTFLTIHGDRLNTKLVNGSASKPSELDALWHSLLASDAFEGDEDFDFLMRHELEPY